MIEMLLSKEYYENDQKKRSLQEPQEVQGYRSLPLVQFDPNQDRLNQFLLK